ncbi:hypothetical protein [Azospirillum agricola]|uniref:hypothetical protein n=1 Tax=Azospirillum agricola TaxID=1720247 RepID=UPI000A0EF949|nr:hypothetical protein [Azospirillum agricola]SMH28800.1 hypothetical protein SAMN02982994_0094 [Azospirillum lipoferum]
MLDAKPDVKLGNMLLHVNLLALGTLMAKLMEELFRQSGDPAAKADEWLRLFETTAGQMTFASETPEWSDLAAQEFRDILMQHIHRARAVALGQDCDPRAYLRHHGEHPDAPARPLLHG